MGNTHATGPGLKDGTVEEFVDTGRVTETGLPIKARLVATLSIDENGVPVPAKMEAGPDVPLVIIVDAVATAVADLTTIDCSDYTLAAVHVISPGSPAAVLEYKVSNTGESGEWIDHDVTATSSTAGMFFLTLKTAWLKIGVKTIGTGNLKLAVYLRK